MKKLNLNYCKEEEIKEEEPINPIPDEGPDVK